MTGRGEMWGVGWGEDTAAEKATRAKTMNGDMKPPALNPLDSDQCGWRTDSKGERLDLRPEDQAIS